MLACTISCHNYLPKARTLARSFRKHHPGARVVLGLVERAVGNGVDVSDFDEVLLPSDLNIDQLEIFMFRHTILEACTAVKARVLRTVMTHFPAEELIFYLDPDMHIFGRFDEACELLGKSNIIVTPHHLIDEDTHDAVRDNVFRTLMCGAYNLGFLGLRRGNMAAAFLEWWHSRLTMFCYVDYQRGLFVDQKWMDLAHSFFDIGVLRSVGYNVANWNISKRKIRFAEDKVLVNDERLRCFHFSKIDSGRDMYFFRKYAGECLEQVQALRVAYKRELEKCGHSELRQAPWTYDFFFSGERVLPDARMVYRNSKRLQDEHPAPFACSNEVLLSAQP